MILYKNKHIFVFFYNFFTVCFDINALGLVTFTVLTLNINMIIRLYKKKTYDPFICIILFGLSELFKKTIFKHLVVMIIEAKITKMK